VATSSQLHLNHILWRRGGKRYSNNCTQARKLQRFPVNSARAPTEIQKRMNDLRKITDSPKTHEASLRCRRNDPHLQPATGQTAALTLSFYNDATQRTEYNRCHTMSFTTSRAFAAESRGTATHSTKSEKRDASSQTRRHLRKSVFAINYRYDRYKSSRIVTLQDGVVHRYNR